MKWNPQEIRDLCKKVSGNCSDEIILAKLAELQAHLKQYEGSFLGLHTKHEWAEVQRLADEVSAMLSEPYGSASGPEMPRREVRMDSRTLA
jgi:hypothetical protein